MSDYDDPRWQTDPVIRRLDQLANAALIMAVLLLVALGMAFSGCVHDPPIVILEPPVIAPGEYEPVRAVAIIVDTPTGAAVPLATCTIQTGQATVETAVGNSAGYVEWARVPSSITKTQVSCEADGYVSASEHRVVPASGQLAVNLTLTPLVVRRTGLVRLDGHVYADDGGPYLGLGASLMWGGWGYLHDRARLEARNLSALRGRVDYIRALAVVGPGGWSDRAVTAADMPEAVAGLTDLAYDHYGLRVDWTIFGGVDTTPTPADREALVRRFAEVISPRAHKVQRVQMGNESWQVGFGGDAGRAELRQLARILHELLPNLISVTSPQFTDGTDVPLWYNGLGFRDRLIVSVHPDRDISGTGGIWRPVRQAWDPQFWTSLAWDTDEPIGPQSSINEDDDPLRLTMAAAYTWLCGGAGYTLHTGAGIRGGGAEDLARGRAANLDEVAHIHETLAGLNAVRALLPADLPNWQRHNSHSGFPGYPFETSAIHAQVERGSLLRAFAATDGARFVVMPIVAHGAVPFAARSAMHLTVYDPLMGAQLEARDLAAGQTYTMTPRDAAVLVGR